MARHTDAPIAAALSATVDPVLFRSLGELGTLRDVRVRRGVARVTVAVPGDRYPAAAELRRRLADRLPEDVREVDLELVPLTEHDAEAIGDTLVAPQPAATGATERPNPFASRSSRTRVLCIASGKGGVGKSSVTVNLAVALAQAGHAVGVLDADIYGFSVPRMLGVGYAPIVLGRAIVPPVAHGVRCISIGFFVDEDQAVAWRGPMLHRAIEQFLVDVWWGDLDFLLIDMPPGTGDIALSVAQQLPRAEVYVVTTPQPSAERVARRIGSLARQMGIPVRGVIENMSWFETPSGERYEPFGSGGGEALARALSVPLLAAIPLVLGIREGADAGTPAVESDPLGTAGTAFASLADAVVELAPTRIYRDELSVSDR